VLEGVYATGSPVRRGRVRLVWAYQRAVLALGHENEYGLFVENDSEQFPLRKDRAKIVRVGCDVPTFRAVSGEGRCTGRDVRALGRTISRNSYDLYFSPSLYTSMPLSSDLPPAVAVRGVVIDLSQDRVMPTLRAAVGQCIGLQILGRSHTHNCALCFRRLIRYSSACIRWMERRC